MLRLLGYEMMTTAPTWLRFRSRSQNGYNPWA
jgi:hypothetical protein